MSKTILVVEDDKSVQKMLTETLEAEGFTVIGERDGEWALRTFESREVDFIILDILIPVMNGFQVAEKIRKTPRGKKVPILMISGIYRGVNHRKDAIRKYGVVDYLDKPLKMDQVLDCLKKTFGAEYPSPVAAQAEREAIDQKEPEPYASPDSHEEKKEVEKKAREFRKAVLRGNLRDTPFAELLARLYREKADGALLLRRDKVKKIVYFKNGYPIFVKSNLLNECLGKVMVREKLISEAECEESIKRMKESNRQQGTVLIEMGCISPHNLQYALQLQLETKLYDIFGWEKGDFQYNPKSLVPPTTVSLETSTAAIIYEGIRRKYTFERLQQLLDPHMERYVVPSDDPLFRFQDMDLDEDEEAFVERIRGDLTLGEILDLGLDRERAAKLIYALHCSGMIEFSDEPAVQSEGEEERKPQPPPPPPPPKARKKQQVALSLNDEGGIPVPKLSTARSGHPLSPEERSMREELAQRLLEMKKQNYFELLGVSRNASTAEIKKAYFVLAKQFHPDRLPPAASGEVRALADEIFSLLSEAHDTLCDEDQRAAYLRELNSGQKREVSSEVSKILTAEGLFQKGEAALRRRKYQEAREYFDEAVKLCPEEGEFRAYLGWATFQCDPKNEDVVREARDHLNQAISLNPKVDKAYLFLGYIYKAMNYREMAEHEFEKAIQCNPDCTEALRELRLINMRRKAAKKKKGFFNRLG